jgi:hypothetical protein
MVVGKIWTSLTYHLNTFMEGKLNVALERRTLAQIIRDDKTLAKYE